MHDRCVYGRRVYATPCLILHSCCPACHACPAVSLHQTHGIFHCATQIGARKTKLTHLMRATAAKIMAERATPFDIIKIMGRWEWTVMTLAYIAKNPAAALPVSIGAHL